MTNDDTIGAEETPDEVRAQVHAIVDQLTDEACRLLWRVLQDWIQAQTPAP